MILRNDFELSEDKRELVIRASGSDGMINVKVFGRPLGPLAATFSITNADGALFCHFQLSPEECSAISHALRAIVKWKESL